MSKGGVRIGPMRAEVLHQLRLADGPMAVAEVAEAVGLHQNTTRFHLDALVEQALVSRDFESRDRPGRPKILYQAVEGHPANPYQDLAQAMTRYFAGPVEDRAARAEAAGVAWGAELRAAARCELPDDQPVQRLVACMDRLGYAPTLIDGAEPVLELVPCPFLELSNEDPDVVCQMHLGLAEGLLGEDQPWRVAAIEPFVTADKCLMRLARRRPAEPELDGDA